MKTKLLLLFAFIISICAFAQIPNGATKTYKFNNGSIGDLTPFGSARTTVVDRFTASSNAINLGGDRLQAGSSTSDDSTISFWIKTSANDANDRTVVDYSSRDDQFDNASEPGHYFYLNNGKIAIAANFTVNSTTTGNVVFGAGYIYNVSTTIVSDGLWHHVVGVIDEQDAGSGTRALVTKLYVDGVLENTVTEVRGVTPSTFMSVHESGQKLTLGDNQTLNMPSNERYYDEIDDVRHYGGTLLNDTQVLDLYNESDCVNPNITFSNIEKFQVDANWSSPETPDSYDIAWETVGTSFDMSPDVTGLTSSSYTISSLQAGVTYDIYLRGVCSGVPSQWIKNAVTTLPPVIYVDINATGTGDGSSWANAYINLKTALTANPTNEFWIAAGTYIPGGTRTDKFDITTGQEIYGGFNGTETTFGQRDINTNVTILSGDINGNDNNTTLSFTEATKSDNSYNILTVLGNNIIIDGFVFENGFNDNGTTGAGAAIRIMQSPNSFSNLDVNNCSFRNNITTGGGGVLFSFDQFNNSDFKFNNCKFYNNLSRFATIAYYRPQSGYDINATFTNSLFYNNYTQANSAVSTTGLFLFRVDNGGSVMDAEFYNCTFSKNGQLTTGTSTNSALLSGLRTSGTLDLRVFNSVFWDNPKLTGGQIKSIGKWQDGTSAISLEAKNSLDPLNFVGVTNAQNNNIANPLFIDAVNSDFSISGSSPAVNAGDNAYLSVNNITDLSGGVRVFSGIVDMGAYEFSDPNAIVYIPDFNFKNYLLANSAINTNGDTEIQFGEANAYTGSIQASSLGIDDITGIEAFTGLTVLDVSNNNIQEINLNINAQLSSVNLSSNTLTFLSIKNGNNSNIITANFNATNNVYLNCIEVDDVSYATSNWLNIDSIASFNTVCNRPIFVDVAAIGLNDGSSWANAYSSLTTALTLNPSGKFWVKAGTYVPSSARIDSFVLTDSQEIYGGFSGTEIALQQRNIAANPTILSGDINGDDAAVFNPIDPNRAENSYRIIQINGTNTVIDGFNIESANANGASSADQEGPVINTLVTGYTQINNCTITKHTASRAGLIRSLDVSGNVTIDFNNNIFKNNETVFATIYYGRALNNTLEVNFEGNLFTNNKATTNSNGSLFWIRQDTNGTNRVSFINSTFSDNVINSGTQVIRYNGSVLSAVVNISNSIFWNNVSSTGTNVNALQGAPGGSIVNTISNNGFTGNPNTTNISTSNPLFIDPINDDYTLQPSSPAIDSGDNSKVSNAVNLDLSGNDRIFNNIVDLGPFEYTSTLSTQGFNTEILDLEIYPNPTSNTLNINTNNSDVKHVEIYDLLGKQVLKTNETAINVSNLKGGIYILKVKTTLGEVIKRFVKQ